MAFVTFCGLKPSYSKNEQGFPIGLAGHPERVASPPIVLPVADLLA